MKILSAWTNAERIRTHRSFIIWWKGMYFSCRSHVKGIKIGYEAFVHFQPCVFIRSITKCIWKRAKLGLPWILWSFDNKCIRNWLETRSSKSISLSHFVTVIAFFIQALSCRFWALPTEISINHPRNGKQAFHNYYGTNDKKDINKTSYRQLHCIALHKFYLARDSIRVWKCVETATFNLLIRNTLIPFSVWFPFLLQFHSKLFTF